MSDLINRQDAIDAIKTMPIVEAMGFISTLSSAQRKGKWLEMGTNTDGTHNIKCSKCGEGYKTRGHARSIATKAKYKYCPNCGARMGEEDEYKR